MTDLRQGVSAGTHDALDLLDAGRASNVFSLDLETGLDDARMALRSIRPGSTFLHDRQACLRTVAVLLDRVDTIDALTDRIHVGKVSL